MEQGVVKASVKNIKTSPRKLNYVAEMIRNKKASLAIAELQFCKKKVALDVRKCLQSVVANADNNHAYNIDNLIISAAYVGKAFVMKRFRARAKGRGARINKFFSNLYIEVREV